VTSGMSEEIQRLVVLTVGLSLCGALGVLGWNKLAYGFNFIDEGMYMVDGWRLANGDRLFPDASVNILTMYTVFNGWIFSLFPDITLLQFRELQFVASIFAAAAMAWSAAKWLGGYWSLPLVLSVVAFTGLDMIGMSSNMSYYTYPHFFFTLFVTCFLFALRQSEGSLSRLLWLGGSGVFLFFIGFSVLPLSAAAVAPVLYWGMQKKIFPGTIPPYNLRDLVITLLPVGVLWLLVFIVFRSEFFSTLNDVIRYLDESRASNGAAIRSIPYFIYSGVIVATALYLTRIKNSVVLVVSTAAFSLSVFFIIQTNLLGTVPGYWNGWFSRPMWMGAFWVVAIIVILGVGYRAPRIIDDGPARPDSELSIALVIAICSAPYMAIFATFSGMGVLTFNHAGIPMGVAAGALVIYLMGQYSTLIKGITIACVLTPFYFHLAKADWYFTYFDLSPHLLDNVINDGFARGIHTNVVYKGAHDWMRQQAENFSEPGDFALVFARAPMGHMIIERRPALNHSWIGYIGSALLKKEAIEQMIRDDREPTIAFWFRRSPFFIPPRKEGGQYRLAGVNADPTLEDPLENYVLTHMVPRSSLEIEGEKMIFLFTQKSDAAEAARNMKSSAAPSETKQ